MTEDCSNQLAHFFFLKNGVATFFAANHIHVMYRPDSLLLELDKLETLFELFVLLVVKEVLFLLGWVLGSVRASCFNSILPPFLGSLAFRPLRVCKKELNCFSCVEEFGGEDMQFADSYDSG